MLLAEYINSLPSPSGNRDVVPMLASIANWRFGEDYLVLANGFYYTLPDLDTALEMIRDEFLATDKWAPVSMLPFARLRNTTTALFVQKDDAVSDGGNAPFTYGQLDEFLDNLRVAVLTFRLSGTWDQYANFRGNL